VCFVGDQDVKPPVVGAYFVVARARAAEAHVIVTGDRHLLELADLRPEPVTPRQFVILLERHGF
jgi:predicted nucleic acid-binding protein